MEMNKNNSQINKPISSVIKIAISNLLKVLAGVLVGFLLPKIIGVADYGYYRTFTLYVSYAGLLSFGFVEGLLLIYGGKDLSELPKEKFRLYSRIFIFFQVLFAAIGALLSLCFKGETRFVFFAFSIHIIGLNVCLYFQTISQITSRFNELSIRDVLYSSLISLAILGIYLFTYFKGEPTDPFIYKLFTILHVSIQLFISLWYLFTYREFVFGKCTKIKENKNEILTIFKIGLPLLVSNLTSTLILAVDRQFVNIFFSINEYAVYSFAYSMFGLFTTATMAISTVLFPFLKRTNEEQLFTTYHNMIAIILMFVFVAISLYYPLCWFVPWFLPNYTNSLIIFRIIIPGLAINSAVTIISHNYYKTSKESLAYFVQCLIVLVLSVALNFAAYYIFKSTTSISIASVVAVVFWYLLTQIYYHLKHNVPILKNTVFMLVMLVVFYGATFIPIWWVGFISYLPVSVLICFAFYPKQLKEMLLKFLSRRKK